MTPQSPACPACGATESIAHDRSFSLDLLRCHRCGLRWTSDPPSADALTSLYAEGFYVDEAARCPTAIQGIHRINSRLRLGELRGVRPARLLDVGAGKGHFLAAARDAGWEVVGVELSASSARRARQQYGLELLVGDVMTLPIDGPFRAITLWHVLEHVPEPGALLGRLAQLLERDGRLIVSVPNARSLQARLFGPDWFHLDMAHHLYHFTPRALQVLLTKHGFALERIGYFYPEMEVLGWIQSLLNRAGYERDQLYRVLKRDPSAGTVAGAIGALGIALALAPVAVAASFALPLARLGASVQVTARLAGSTP